LIQDKSKTIQPTVEPLEVKLIIRESTGPAPKN